MIACFCDCTDRFVSDLVGNRSVFWPRGLNGLVQGQLYITAVSFEPPAFCFGVHECAINPSCTPNPDTEQLAADHQLYLLVDACTVAEI